MYHGNCDNDGDCWNDGHGNFYYDLDRKQYQLRLDQHQHRVSLFREANNHASFKSSKLTKFPHSSTSTTPVPVSSDSNNPNLAAIIGGVVGGVVGIALIGGGAYYAAKKARADVDKERPIMVSGITQGEMATVPKFPPPGPMPLTTNGTALSASSLATTSTLASASSGTLPPTMAPLLVLPTTPPTTADPSTLPSQYQPRAQSSVAQDIPSNVAEPLPVAPLLLPVDPSLPMRCTRPFKAGMEDELDVETGDVVNVLVRHEGWFLFVAQKKGSNGNLS